MSDDNNFSLGEILWEYADFTPEEIPAIPVVPLPPETPLPPDEAPIPAAPIQPTMPAPQPATHPSAEPPQEKPAEAQPKTSTYLPANQPLPANQQPQTKPTAPPATQETKAEQPVQQPEPAAQAPAQEAQPAPEAPAQPQPEESNTGLPDDSGPDLIAFTPDPTPPVGEKQEPDAEQQQSQPAQQQEQPAGQQEQPAQQQEQPAQQQEQPAQQQEQPAQQQEQPAQQQEQPAQQQEQPAQQQEQPAQQQEQPAQQQGQATQQQGQTSQQQGQAAGQQTRPGQQQTQTAARGSTAEGFRLKRERKAKPAPEVPPDALPGQLLSEYSAGLSGMKSRCITASILCVLLMAVSLLSSGLIAPLAGLLPDIISMLLGLVLIIVIAVLCGDVLRNGLVQLGNGKPNENTLALGAFVFTLLDCATLLAFNLRTSTLPFFAPCALVLTFHLIGMYCTQSARYRMCRTASSVDKPYMVTQDANILAGQPAFRKWIGIPRGFGSQVRTQSMGSFRFQRMTPVLMIACICLCLITTVAHHQPKLAFWSLSALFCAASTLGAGMTFSLPMRLLDGKLSKLGVALAGAPGAAAGKGCKATVLRDYDLYPPGTVTLMTARPFGSWNMAEAASFAASVVRASGSGLAYVFDRILRSEGGNYVQVEKIVMQEGGLMGQCQGETILVGNGDYIARHGISLPQGVRSKDAVFCTVGGEVAGMFVLKYNLTPSVIPSLQGLFAHRLHPILVPRDFNLTPQHLRLWGRLPVDQVSFPDLQRRVTLSGPNQVHGKELVAVLCREGIASLSAAVIGAKRIRRSSAFAYRFVSLSAVVGIILTASLSSAAAFSSMSAWNLSLFLILWLVPVLLVSLWTTKY